MLCGAGVDLFLDFGDELGDVFDLFLDDGAVGGLAVAWDDFGVFVAEFVCLVECEEPADGRAIGGGVEEGVESCEYEVAGVDYIFVFEVDDEVVVGVSWAEVVEGDATHSVGGGYFVCLAVYWMSWGDVLVGPGVRIARGLLGEGFEFG